MHMHMQLCLTYLCLTHLQPCMGFDVSSCKLRFNDDWPLEFRFLRRYTGFDRVSNDGEFYSQA